MQYFDIEIKVLQSYVLAEDEIQAYEKLIKHLTHYVQFRVKSAYGTVCSILKKTLATLTLNKKRWLIVVLAAAFAAVALLVTSCGTTRTVVRTQGKVLLTRK